MTKAIANILKIYEVPKKNQEQYSIHFGCINNNAKIFVVVKNSSVYK